MTPQQPNHERKEPSFSGNYSGSVFLDIDESDTVASPPSERRRKYLEDKYARKNVPSERVPEKSTDQDQK